MGIGSLRPQSIIFSPAPKPVVRDDEMKDRGDNGDGDCLSSSTDQSRTMLLTDPQFEVENKRKNDSI